MSQRPLHVEEARAVTVAAVRRLPAEEVALVDALGRTLAEDVRSEVALPAHDVSAMDGFAVRAADTAASGIALALVGESRAGHPAGATLGSGEAMRISTGAVIPSGADAVVRREDAELQGAHVSVGTAVAPGHDVRRAGEAVEVGALVLGAGTLLGPAELGALASVGRPRVRCTRAPRVAVLTTGDELLTPGEALPPGAIWNSNAFAVAAQAQRAGAEVVARAHVGDDERATHDALAELLSADVVVVCGGVSVGEHDHVRRALDRLGVEQLLWRVALRPGGPMWVGRSPGTGTLVLGLPGNPVSAMVTFQLFALPAIRTLLGASPSPRRATAVLGADHAKRPGMVHAVRCRLDLDGDPWRATPTGPQGSHVFGSMVGADALAMLERERGDVRAGERVELELL